MPELSLMADTVGPADPCLGGGLHAQEVSKVGLPWMMCVLPPQEGPEPR